MHSPEWKTARCSCTVVTSSRGRRPGNFSSTRRAALAAVVLTSSGEGRALILIGAVFVVGAIGFRLIFNRNHQRPPELPEEANEETKERAESK